MPAKRWGAGQTYKTDMKADPQGAPATAASAALPLAAAAAASPSPQTLAPETTRRIHWLAVAARQT